MLACCLEEAQFQTAKAMAESKRDYLIKTFGDANGERRKEYYLKELIYEATVQHIYLEAMFTDFRLKDMEKECSENRNTLIR